jgi:DNA-binding XRE family transcriptional regulator
MINTNIGFILRNARLDHEMTQQEVADWLGVSLWTYNRLENGKRHFDKEWIKDLPPKLRFPVVQYLQNACNDEMVFLSGLAQLDAPRPLRRGDAPRSPLARGDLQPAV